MTKTLPAFALAALLLAAPACAGAQAITPAPGAGAASPDARLDLSAYGETQVAPDQASLSLGVRSTAPSAAQALRANAEQMSAVMAALHGSGVADKAIQTSDISLQAQYDDQPTAPARLTGYQASNQVTVAVTDLAALGPVLDAAVAAGANQVSGVSFGLKDPAMAEDAARRAAVKALFAKAQLYAVAAGFQGARLIEMSEGGSEAAGPVPMMAMARMRGAPTPVAAGELSVRAELSGVFVLVR